VARYSSFDPRSGRNQTNLGNPLGAEPAGLFMRLECAGSGYFLAAFFTAASLILARCKAANPPELVKQSLPAFALHWGHTREIGLTGSTSGMETFFFTMPRVYADGVIYCSK